MDSVARRAIIMVLDGVGIGELPDAVDYGDKGSNTIANTAREVGGMSLPCLESLGLGNIAYYAGFEISGVSPIPNPKACFGRMATRSSGKDTTTGHWEMCGVVLDRPFPTYPNGFPPEIIHAFEEAIGRPSLGNMVASGTEIIKLLGDEHVSTGYPIVYTSADSVFQIAAHEDVISPDELYSMCEAARVILSGPHAVGRVIARPFSGPKDGYVRTKRRRDFALPPPTDTLLDLVSAQGLSVMGCGKIDDIFANRGLTHTRHVVGNDETIDAMLESLAENRTGLIFANLIDFDQKYGHRNDPEGFASALARVDQRLPEIMSELDRDILIITADHGNDPTTPSTDHTREYVPLLAWHPGMVGGAHLGARDTLADLGATVAEYLKVPWTLPGSSFLSSLGVES